MYVSDSRLVETVNATRQMSTEGVTVVPHVAVRCPPSMVMVEFAAYGTQEMGCTSRPAGNVRFEQRLAQSRAMVVLSGAEGTEGTGTEGKAPMAALMPLADAGAVEAEEDAAKELVLVARVEAVETGKDWGSIAVVVVLTRIEVVAVREEGAAADAEEVVPAVEEDAGAKMESIRLARAAPNLLISSLGRKMVDVMRVSALSVFSSAGSWRRWLGTHVVAAARPS
jgi:hypothetical protein